jgi:histidinol-phosphate aminotransferase
MSSESASSKSESSKATSPVPVRSKYWSELVEQLEPYVPGEQPKIQGLTKLNTNENPYPPSPKVVAAITEDVIEHLRLYPDPSSACLKNVIANHFSVPQNCVFVGNGSDEVLAFAFQAFFQQDAPILFPDITYGFYPVYCNLYGVDSIELPLMDDFTINLSDYYRENGGIIFPNPNAPTGVVMGLEAIEGLLQKNTHSVVIVDEAYIDFGSESATGLVARYPNLLVVQTLSKSRSLAGVRVGFAVGSPELVNALERIKNSFNPYSIDRIAELAAIAAIEDVDYFEACCQKVIATRESTVVQLQALGFDVLPSKANFIMAKPNGLSAIALFEALREEKILVRYFSKPRIDEYLRITIGTDEDMRLLIDVIKTIQSRSL